jgi:CheY-like chemotaxis protein
MEERHKLEEIWLRRLEHCRHQYEAATLEYRRLLRQDAERCPSRPNSSLDRARQVEAAALVEYARALGIFTDLILRGKLPGETLDESGEVVTVKPYRVSVVDDDESIRDSTRTLLRSVGFDVRTFGSAELFLESGILAETQCIVLDIRMPGMGGLELQKRLNASKARVPVVFLTAHDDANSRKAAIEGGAVDFLCKPFEANSLVSAVQTALARGVVDKLGGS